MCAIVQIFREVDKLTSVFDLKGCKLFYCPCKFFGLEVLSAPQLWALQLLLPALWEEFRARVCLRVCIRDREKIRKRVAGCKWSVFRQSPSLS